MNDKGVCRIATATPGLLMNWICRPYALPGPLVVNLSFLSPPFSLTLRLTVLYILNPLMHVWENIPTYLYHLGLQQSHTFKKSSKKGKRCFNTKLIDRCLRYVGYGLQKLLGNCHYSVMGMWRNGKVRYHLIKTNQRSTWKKSKKVERKKVEKCFFLW